MNQILSMDSNNPSFGNNYNNNMNGGNNGKLDNKTSKRIFAIGMIIFGLAMFISGLLGVIDYFSTPEGPGVEYPIFATSQNDNILTISVQNDVAIDVIEYSWNNGRVSEILGNGSTEIVREITIPEGNNVLTLNIIDINGKTTTKTESVVGPKLEDTSLPEIEVVVVSSKLNITAKTVGTAKLSYLTYRWNDDEEIRIDATGDGSTIETTIDVLNGDNTLTIVAVKENGISAERVATYTGIKKPVIEVKKDADGLYLLVTISHESGIKSVDIQLNGRNQVVSADQLGQPTLDLKFRLKEDSNTIEIEATSMDGSVETFTGTASRGR